MQRPQSSQVSVYQINGLWRTDDPKQYHKYICKKSYEKLVTNDNNLIGNCPSSNSLDPLQSWVDVNKKSKYCYWFSVDLDSSVGSDTRYSSAFHCKQRNGTLLSIHSMFDLLILKNKITSKSSSSYSYYNTWLGLYQSPQGAYIWDDGSAVDFTNWDETNGNYDSSSQADYCACIRVTDLKWTKYKCASYLYYICQVPKIYDSTQVTPKTITSSSDSPINSTIGSKPNTDTGGSVGLSNGAKAGIIIAVVFVAYAVICAAVFATIKYRSRDPSVNSFGNSLYFSKRRIAKEDEKTDSM